MIGHRKPARMRALGMELAAFRMHTGKTTIQAARGIGKSAATLNRTEKANRVSPITDVAGLLALYGITGAARERILDLARDLEARAWLETGDRLPLLLPALAAFESQSRTLIDFAPHNLPGLLQTPAYARAIHAACGITGKTQDAMVEARLDRQKVLAKLAAPTYTAIIDEAAFRRGHGGSEVMVQQIHWLIGKAEQPGINIHVIPFRLGGYRNPGQFSTMEFRESPLIVYVEHEGASGFLDASEDTHLFRDLTANLVRFALGSTETVNFLHRMAADYERS
ncbi:helix-turn-helix domain-containing protein [Actinokineospora sp. HUAS TT18]|uniref:helix-turn-helix domain-containing protein n=1 Tax=Actinokineospora sp. HUAS TT18 TaxID=3447451 RepID=UPI003F51B5AB